MSYAADKQLGNVLRFTDVTANAQVGTAQQLYEARGILFQQTTVGIAVTLPNPTAPTPKMLTVLNRGSVAISVQGLTIEPGPAYGLYYDGVNYVPTAIEGAGRIGSTQDSTTVALTGDGSSTAPLIAALKLSSAIGNGLTVNSDGLFYAASEIGAGSTVWVDSVNGLDSNPGTLGQPYQTIGRALNDSPKLVLCYPGTYAEDIFQTGAAIIQGYGVSKSHIAKLSGSVSIGGDATSMLRFKDFDIIGNLAGTAAVTITNMTADLAWENVSISHAAGVTQKAINVIGAANSGNFILKNSDIDGKISIEDAAQTTGAFSVIVDGGRGSPEIDMSVPAATVIVLNRLGVGPITHAAGKLFTKGIGVVNGDTNGNGLTSTATAASNSFLSLQDTGFVKSDGSVTSLIKTGDAPYVFGDIKTDPSNILFTGTRHYVENATHIHANYSTPTAYTPVDDSIVGHLEGINAALAASAGGLAAVTHTDSTNVALTGAGTTLSPLVATSKVSAASGNALQSVADGLFVSTVDQGLEAVTTSDSDVISFTGDGTPTDPLIADVILSPDARNLITRDITNGGALIVVEKTKTVELAFSIAYNWLAQEYLFLFVSTEQLLFAQNLPTSKAAVILTNGDNGSTFNHVANLYKNGTQVGTITFAGTAVTFALAQDLVVNTGDVLSLISVDNATFESIAITLAGTRPLSGA